MSARDLAELRRILIDRLSLDELKTLCFDLGISYDDVNGENKPAKARELIAYCQARGRLPELIETLRTTRPDIALPATSSTRPAPPGRVDTGYAPLRPRSGSRRNLVMLVGGCGLLSALLCVVTLMPRLAGLIPGSGAPPGRTAAPVSQGFPANTTLPRPTPRPSPTVTAQLPGTTVDLGGKWVGIFSETSPETVRVFRYTLDLTQTGVAVTGEARIEPSHTPTTFVRYAIGGILVQEGNAVFLQFSENEQIETGQYGYFPASRSREAKRGRLQYTSRSGVDSLEGLLIVREGASTPIGSVKLERVH